MIMVVIFDFFRFFYLVCLEFRYHVSLVLLKVDFGKEFTLAVDADELDNVSILIELLGGRLVFL